MLIRLTPVHLRVLELVRDRGTTWRSQTGPTGGFGNSDGTRIPPSSELIALYELRNAYLITVDKAAGRVAITAAGMSHLTRNHPPLARQIRPAS